MIRDPHLFRQVLLACEKDPSNIKVDGHTQDEILFHVHLLGFAGFMDVHDISKQGDILPKATAINLTETGQEFLNHIRSDSVWKKVKSKIHKAGRWNLKLLRDYAFSEAYHHYNN